MNITKSQLKQIIKEELEKVMKEIEEDGMQTESTNDAYAGVDFEAAEAELNQAFQQPQK